MRLLVPRPRAWQESGEQLKPASMRARLCVANGYVKRACLYRRGGQGPVTVEVITGQIPLDVVSYQDVAGYLGS